MTASVRPGMGALPYAGGTTFRVWAPFAKSVCVAGTFNSWHMTANPLTHEGNGYWSADIPEARVGDQYKFVLTSPFRNDPLWKNDPVLARERANELLCSEVRFREQSSQLLKASRRLARATIR